MGKVLSIKVKERGSRQGVEYKNKIELSNPSLIALALEDLEQMFNAPLRKACKIFLEKEKVFPFSP